MVGLPGVPGHLVPKPVEPDRRTGNEPVLVTIRDMANAPAHMKRHVTVTHRNAPVSQVCIFLYWSVSKSRRTDRWTDE